MKNYLCIILGESRIPPPKFYLKKVKIFNFRLSSEIFPFATHSDYYETYDLDQFDEDLKKIGNYAKEKGSGESENILLKFWLTS